MHSSIRITTTLTQVIISIIHRIQIVLTKQGIVIILLQIVTKIVSKVILQYLKEIIFKDTQRLSVRCKSQRGSLHRQQQQVACSIKHLLQVYFQIKSKRISKLFPIFQIPKRTAAIIITAVLQFNNNNTSSTSLECCIRDSLK